MKVNDRLEVLIENMDKDGQGIAYYNKKIIFIKGAIIGELCEIEVTKVLKKLIQAKLIKIIKQSEYRRVVDCKIYDKCGGCNLRHLSYELEKEIKSNKVKNTLIHVSKINDFKFNSLISNNQIYYYRNKAIVPFSKIDNKVICGMYEAASHNIIPNTNCLIEPKLLDQILKIVVNYLEENNISIYDETTKKGLFRAVMCRKTKDDSYMVVLITTSNYNFSNLVNKLITIPNIKSIYLNVNESYDNVLLSDNNILIYGNPTISEDILDHQFNVSPNTFLQVNNQMAELLYEEAIRLLNPTKEDTIIDAYCGMGSISLSIADKVKKVIGIEVVESAVEDAKNNAKRNNINNSLFINGKCEDVINEVVKKEKVDAVIFDPPRKGCDKHFLDVIKSTKIPKIVYVSCNVATLARDILYLKDLYDVVEVTPVDLFPRTSHIESVTLLELKK